MHRRVSRKMFFLEEFFNGGEEKIEELGCMHQD